MSFFHIVEGILGSQPSSLQVMSRNCEGILTFNGGNDQSSKDGTGENSKQAGGDFLARGVHARRRRA